MSKGILYIATGKQYIEEAKNSARFVKKHMNYPITLVTDQSVEDDIFDTVIIDDNPNYDYSDKIRNLNKTPYTRTIFIDTDVYLLDDVSELFSITKHKDLAIALDQWSYGHRYKKLYHFDNVPESVPIYQTGVISYKMSDKVIELFELWETIHDSDKMLTDQSSFRAAIFESNINLCTVSNLYNCPTNSPMMAVGPIKIIHDTNGLFHNKNYKKQIEKMSNIMNKTHNYRIFHSPKKGIILVPTSKFWTYIYATLSVITNIFYTINIILSSIRKNGVGDTIDKLSPDNLDDRSPLKQMFNK